MTNDLQTNWIAELQRLKEIGKQQALEEFSKEIGVSVQAIEKKMEEIRNCKELEND